MPYQVFISLIFEISLRFWKAWAPWRC